MTSENTQQRVAWPVAYGEAPRHGSRAMAINLNFSVESPVNINLTDDQMHMKLEFIQSIYVDNSLNPNALTFTCRTTNQIITVPATWQGYIPLVAPTDNPKISFATPGTLIIPVQLLSYPVPCMLWPTSNVFGVSQQGSIGTDYSGAAAATAIAAVIASSTLLATIPVNAGRNYLEAQNQSIDTLQLIRDDGAGANQSLTVLNPAAAVGSQGGAWTDNYFRGRLRLYSTGAASQFSLREE